MPHSLQQAIFITIGLNTLACQDAVDETDTSAIIEEESVQAQNEPLHAHGYLDSHHRWHAHRTACREIIRPAA
ncbi:MAG: hypothetical protein ACON4U_09015 [Myxococcota bacterium]